jgi:hypothetical protein
MTPGNEVFYKVVVSPNAIIRSHPEIIFTFPPTLTDILAALDYYIEDTLPESIARHHLVFCRQLVIAWGGSTDERVIVAGSIIGSVTQSKFEISFFER